jgi:hypothetical protein
MQLIIERGTTGPEASAKGLRGSLTGCKAVRSLYHISQQRCYRRELINASASGNLANVLTYRVLLKCVQKFQPRATGFM